MTITEELPSIRKSVLLILGCIRFFVAPGVPRKRRVLGPFRAPCTWRLEHRGLRSPSANWPPATPVTGLRPEETPLCSPRVRADMPRSHVGRANQGIGPRMRPKASDSSSRGPVRRRRTQPPDNVAILPGPEGAKQTCLMATDLIRLRLVTHSFAQQCVDSADAPLILQQLDQEREPE
jgi:hypothetical protein